MSKGHLKPFSSAKDALWKLYFQDPAQWWDNRYCKVSPLSPDFKHKDTKESLWIDGPFVPAWALGELQKRGLGLPTIAKDAREVKPIRHPQDSNVEETALVTVLKACSKKKDMCTGTRVHADIWKIGVLEKSCLLADALVTMYAKCGALVKAQDLLDTLLVRKALSWTALIAGYVEQQRFENALHCFEMMLHEGLSPNAVTFACILKACANIGAADKGELIYDEISKRELLGNNIVLGTALVDMFSKCGALAKAKEVLEKLPVRDVVAWSALIAGYAQHGYGKEAWSCYEQMQQDGCSPDAVTYISILKACASIRAADKGEKVHDEIAKQGLLRANIVLATALVDMYAKCGALAKAQQVLEGLPARDVICWNALIAGYAQQGQGEDAIDCFEKMQDEGLTPNAVTFTCILSACGSVRDAYRGEQIHDEIIRQGLLGSNVVLGNALVDMYAKCGALAKARQVLKELSVRNVISWNALITGYAQEGWGHHALKSFEQMKLDGHSPNEVTFTCVLKACGSVGAADQGEQIHEEITRQGLLQDNAVLGTALVDMYATCGDLARAQRVLEQLPFGDVVSWSALIARYAQQGHGEEALNCFEQMQRKGISPNAVTFSSVLNACSHSGLVDKAEKFFSDMGAKFGIEPDLEHYTCIIALFGHVGHMQKAVKAIQRMPSSDYSVVWSTMLAACRKWADVNFGRWAFEHAVQVDEDDATPYVYMASIYAATGMRQEAESIEAMRVKNKAQKKQGCSWWIDAEGNVHSFIAGETKHPQKKLIHVKTEEMANKISQERNARNLQWMSKKMDGFSSSSCNMDYFGSTWSTDHRDCVPCDHCHKYALACALINIPQGETVRIVNNVPLCADCHGATSFVSNIEKCKVVVRDPNTCHVFEDGKCSCGS